MTYIITLLIYYNDLATWIKYIFLSIISFITGFTFVESYMLLFFQDAGNLGDSGWLPTILGGIGGLIVVIIGQISSYFLEQKAERERDARKKLDDKNAQHITFTDKIAELQQERDEKFIEELKKFHEDKVDFKESIIRELKISEYTAKQREYLAMNEINRLWAYINICHRVMKMNGIDIPDISFKDSNELMSDAQDKINKYIESLDRENY